LGLQLPLLITLLVGFFDNFYCVEVLSADNDICRLFKDGVKLRKPGYCNIGIICQNFKSVDNVACEDSTYPYYDRNTMGCAKSTSDDYCSAPCVTKSNGYIQDPKNCKGWYNCNGKTAISSGYCSDDLLFNSTTIMCDYPENSSCSATFTLCDVVPDSTPFLSEDNCDEYYECVNSKSKSVMQAKACDSGKYFDVNTGTCVAKSHVNCSKHPYPNEVCGNTKLAIRNRFVSDDATCRGYFYCKDLGVGTPDPSPSWGQCPTTTFFDSTQEGCVSRTSVRCGEDRCDGRDDGYELSSTPGCQYYLSCESSRTVEEKYCGDNMWFDAATEKCTSTKKSYTACA
ncbi:peritrophin-44-like, partial [Anastrepha obliqua]|uniref:peritrophin-44-like n=1 Tax=Anastrepha obliqua TaxID=95512 RepID=UPI00240A1320